MVTTYGSASFQRMEVWADEANEDEFHEARTVGGRLSTEALLLGRGEDER
jgi:hypothetical protein